MGLHAQTAVGDIQFTVLLGCATKHVTRLVPSNCIVFTRGQVKQVVDALIIMRNSSSVNPVTRVDVRYDEDIYYEMRGWYQAKLEHVGYTINKLEAWLLLDEKSLTFG